MLHSSRKEYALMSREAVRESPPKSCMLSQMETLAIKGVQLPKPPHARGTACRTRPSRRRKAFRCSTVAAVMNDWGDHVSKRATVPWVVVAVGST